MLERRRRPPLIVGLPLLLAALCACPAGGSDGEDAAGLLNVALLTAPRNCSENPATPAVLPAGGSSSGVLPTGRICFYRFTAGQSADSTFTLESTQGHDTDLAVGQQATEPGAGLAPAQAWNSGDCSAFGWERCSAEPGSAREVLTVTTSQGLGRVLGVFGYACPIGGCSFTLTGSAPPGTGTSGGGHPAGSLLNPHPLSVGSPTQGTLTWGDAVYYSVTIPAGLKLTVNLTNLSCNVDLQLKDEIGLFTLASSQQAGTQDESVQRTNSGSSGEAVLVRLYAQGSGCSASAYQLTSSLE